MITKRTLARSVAGLALAWVGACGGDDGGDQDAAPPRDGAAAGDAGLEDAAVVDCAGDHRESAENSNNPFPSGSGSAERTGLTLAAGGSGFTLCGEIDPGQATEQVADYDSFAFTVDGRDSVIVRIEMAAAPASGALLALDLFRVDEGPPVQLATGPFRNDYALIAGLVLTPGTYWVSAVAWLPGPDDAFGYSIAVTENALACPSSAEAPYQEMNDLAGSRGNDMVTIDETDPPPRLTELSDAPEPTAILLEPGAVQHVRGTSDLVESDGDSYLDRDAYLIETGPSTSELELRLTWADSDVDLDMYLFEAGAPENDYSVKLGTSIGTKRDELMTLNVDPSRSYWLWVAAFDTANGGSAGLPMIYDVTLCPREHGVAVEPRAPEIRTRL